MPTFGICTSPDNAAVMAEAGFDYVEGSCQAYFRGREGDDAFAGLDAYRDDCPLPIPTCNLLVPGDLKIVGPDRDAAALHEYMANLLRRAGAAKVEKVVFGSGAARKVPDGVDREKARKQIIAFLKDAAPMAERAGVTIVIEPLHRGECNIINTVGEGMDYVRAVGSERVKILVDSYHFWVEKEPLANVRAAGKDLVHVHVADEKGRLAPAPDGEGPERYHSLFSTLKQIGFDGRISIEGKVDFEPDALRQTNEFLRDAWRDA